MNVRVQSAEQIAQAAEQLGERAEQIANVTYTAPTETGEVEVISSVGSVSAASGALADAVPRVGRNDPCPCGSGKKYKHCHGKLD
jgi:preprotein translocase subunit SecA